MAKKAPPKMAKTPSKGVPKKVVGMPKSQTKRAHDMMPASKSTC